MARCVRLFPPRCTCGIPLGSRQWKIESLIEGGIPFVDALESEGLNHMCDRTHTYLSPLYFVRTTDKGRLKFFHTMPSEVYHLNAEGLAPQQIDTPRIIPLHPPPSFPKEAPQVKEVLQAVKIPLLTKPQPPALAESAPAESAPVEPAPAESAPVEPEIEEEEPQGEED